jgi:hypothetical protein
MVWWLFRKRDDHLKKAFEAVKSDIKKAADWISHLNNKSKQHESAVEIINSRLNNIDERLSGIEEEMSTVKNFITFFDSRLSKQLFKQQQTGVDKQTAVEVVQTPVQTGVQTAFLRNLSVMERAIIWVLANTDLKLSYEDIAALLNKEKSTIRGQINAIKQKSEGLIEEIMEKNGKKRFFVPEKVKEMLLSSIKTARKKSKKEKSETYKIS